ncbi:unnamed protein product, partial [Ectocarpus sp. 12 AP-2014]
SGSCGHTDQELCCCRFYYITIIITSIPSSSRHFAHLARYPCEHHSLSQLGKCTSHTQRQRRATLANIPPNPASSIKISCCPRPPRATQALLFRRPIFRPTRCPPSLRTRGSLSENAAAKWRRKLLELKQLHSLRMCLKL